MPHHPETYIHTFILESSIEINLWEALIVNHYAKPRFMFKLNG